MKNPVLLVDADVLCHKIAYACTKVHRFDDEDPAVVTHPEEARERLDNELEALVNQFSASELIVCLSSREGNFRKDLAEYYKATRRPKPELWEVTRSYLELEQINHRVVQFNRLEGDDALGILHTGMYLGKSIMVTIDKDMRTIPGRVHFTNKQRGVEEITPRAAAMFHLSQVITGDSTDEYPGLPGAGPARWTKIAAEWDGRKMLGLWDLVVKAYKSKGKTEEDAILQARLAFILREGFYHHKSGNVILWEPKHYENL